MANKILFSIIIFLFAGLAFNFSASAASAYAPSHVVSFKIGADSLRILEIQKRVMDIANMDFSKLSKDEKRSLRKELKQMEQETRSYTGIYVSVGALIIIILLLIILLR